MTKKIETVKEQRDIEGNLIGYLLNGSMSVPLVENNSHYIKIMEWIKNGGVAEPYMADEEIAQKITDDRYKRLEKLVIEKTNGLRALVVDEPWSSSIEYIQTQEAIYEKMYESAKAGHFSKKQSEIIIKLNEQAKDMTANLVLLINVVKSKARNMIESNDPRVDVVLDMAENVSLKKEDLTPNKIQEIQAQFLGD